MTPNQLRHVLALADAGTFGRAAAALKISQPTLTKSVQSLERELGVRLFDRQPRGIALTAFGVRVERYARAQIAGEDDLRHDLALIAGSQVGRLAVALGPYPSVISGYVAASRLAGLHPGLAISINVSNWRNVTKAVANREVDIGIAELTDADGNDELATEALGAHRARFVCRPGHPILSGKPVTVSRLQEFPWVTTRLPPRIAQDLPRPLKRSGQIDDASGEFVPAIELDVPMQLAAFGRDSDALTLCAFGMVEHEIRTRALAVVPIGVLDIRARYGFIWLRHRSLSPATMAFMEAVRRREREFVQMEGRLAANYQAN